MRTCVYVDGFNLYYGALRNTAYKWLDVARLCGLLLPNHDITRIAYFTARVSARVQDPGQPARQAVYLRALATIPHLTIVEGSFITKNVRMRLARPPLGTDPYVTVVKSEEKGSDVNLASHLLRDAFQDRLDVAVLVSNDSDLVLPIRIVREELSKTVGILNPHRVPSHALNRHRDFYKPIRRGVLRASQFPPSLVDAEGEITKPATW